MVISSFLSLQLPPWPWQSLHCSSFLLFCGYGLIEMEQYMQHCSISSIRSALFLGEASKLLCMSVVPYCFLLSMHSMVWMNPSLFNISPIKGHLSHFQFGLLKSHLLQTYAYMFCTNISPRVQLLHGHMDMPICLLFVFVRICQTHFPQWCNGSTILHFHRHYTSNTICM
jgi:hypothetical protein